MRCRFGEWEFERCKRKKCKKMLKIKRISAIFSDDQDERFLFFRQKIAHFAWRGVENLFLKDIERVT